MTKQIILYPSAKGLPTQPTCRLFNTRLPGAYPSNQPADYLKPICQGLLQIMQQHLLFQLEKEEDKPVAQLEKEEDDAAKIIEEWWLET